MTTVKRLSLTGAMIALGAALALTMLGGPTHVAAQNGSDPEAYITVVIANGDDTVS